MEVSRALDASRSPDSLEQYDGLYGQTFWLAYAANVVLVMANALTFRFAELVDFLGGSEAVAGMIVSVGMLASVAVRFTCSHWIDEHGTQRVWPAMTGLFAVGCVMFLVCTEISWTLYLARICYFVGLTGMFACSMTHIQNSVPVHRRTEIIGNLGSSGFVGMVLGANLGDWLLRALPQTGRLRFDALFGGALVLAIIYLVIIWRLRIITPPRAPHEPSLPAYRLIFAYWPGSVVAAALIMGLGVTVTQVFLTRFATANHIPGIGTFFTAYALAAFSFRLAISQWSHSIGRYWMLVRGLLGHTLGHALLPWVTQEWQFVGPAVLCGFGHALLFPAVVSLGSGAYPATARGAGTAMILGFTDFGSLIFAAILGRVIVDAGFPAMFLVSSAAAGSTALVIAIIAIRHPDPDRIRPALDPPAA